ncbi:hypothetical protein LTS10_001651 [Elasticomyces elasticus]|nr:hypothetical protein LTS10_001651 [Elasticomyces elasticus]
MPSDRTFQFISDPNHKENLSGRVTAACLNCRRKKIKCSGEAECRQCREKGVPCEGPPSRKRPHRDLTVRTNGNEVSSPTSPADSPGRAAFSRPSTPNRPHAGNPLYGLESTSSHTSPSTSSFGDSRRTSADSGRAIHPLPPRRLYQQVPYELEHPDTLARPLTVVPPERSPFAFTQAFRGHQPGVNDGSPVTTAPSEWSSIPVPSAGDLPLASLTTNQILGRSMLRNQLPGSTPTPTTASGSTGTFSGGSVANSAGRNSRPQSPHRLVRIAEALETEASTFRRLAHHRQMEDLQGQASSLRLLSQQRQSNRTSMEGYEDYGGLAQSMVNYEQGSDSNWITFGDPAMSETPFQFDPSTILRPDGTLRSGYTPPGVDYGMTDIDEHDSHHHFGFGMSNPLYDAQQTPMPATTANGDSNQGYGLGVGRMQRVFHERLVADQDVRAAWSGAGGDQDFLDDIIK